MSLVLDFFSFLWRVLRRTLGFLVSLPGMIVSSVSGLAASVSLMVRNVTDYAQSIVTFIDTCKERVQAFTDWVNSIPAFPMISHLIALDVLYTAFTSVCSFVFAIISTVFVMIAINLLVIFIPFWIYKLVCKIIQLLTAGFAEPT